VEAHLLASKAHRVAQGLGGVCALLLGLGVTLSGCAAPQFTYVANSGQSTYFKVPHGWHKISDSSLANELKSTIGAGGGWQIAYEGGRAPSASDFLSFGATQPFVFADVGQLTATASNQLSYNGLRDYLFPVTSTARQNATAQGFPLSGFKQIRDQTLTLGQGVHGVRETFEYSYNGVTDTFDQVALTNANQTILYLLLLHCTTSCYSSDQSEINDVMSSFTIRSS
jgi:hypothetical protein